MRDKPDFEMLLQARPSSLTLERALACLPVYEIDPEWAASRASGSQPPGILGLSGMLRASWPEQPLTAEEVRWILAVREHVSWRTLAALVVQDENQIIGKDLETAARRALGRDSRADS